MNKIKNIYSIVTDFLTKKENEINLIIFIFGYIFVYYQLIYLLYTDLVSLYLNNINFVSILLFTFYLILLMSTFWIKNKSPYKIILLILIIEIFI